MNDSIGPGEYDIEATDPPRSGGVVILVILLMVAAVALGSVLWFRSNLANTRARAAQARVEFDFVVLAQATSLFHTVHGRYPASAQELLSSTTGEPILDELPVDPWTDQPYLEEQDSLGRVVFVTYGRDGVPGGEGLDADIVSGQ